MDEYKVANDRKVKSWSSKDVNCDFLLIMPHYDYFEYQKYRNECDKDTQVGEDLFCLSCPLSLEEFTEYSKQKHEHPNCNKAE